MIQQYCTDQVKRAIDEAQIANAPSKSPPKRIKRRRTGRANESVLEDVPVQDAPVDLETSTGSRPDSRAEGHNDLDERKNLQALKGNLNWTHSDRSGST